MEIIFESKNSLEKILVLLRSLKNCKLKNVILFSTSYLPYCVLLIQTFLRAKTLINFTQRGRLKSHFTCNPFEFVRL